MVASRLPATCALALVAGIVSIQTKTELEEEIQREGFIKSYLKLTDEEKMDKLKPLLKKFIQHLPAPYTSLPDSAAQRFPGAYRALHDLDIAYEGHVHEPFFVKVDEAKAVQAVKSAGLPAKEAVYGEVQPLSFVQMLDKIEAQPGMRYYDLGSGMGKTVIMAALLGFNATGVELVEQRWRESCKALRRARRRGLTRDEKSGRDANFERASLLDIDLSDADIIFADSVLFTTEMIQSLANRAGQMKPGAKIISASGLPGPGFKDVTGFVAPSSWSERSKWKVQEVAQSGNGASFLVSNSKGKRVGEDRSTSCSLADTEDEAAMLDTRSTSFRARLGVTIVASLLLLSTLGEW